VYFDLLPRAINPPFATNFAGHRICGFIALQC
jgi:hypothetical protein